MNRKLLVASLVITLAVIAAVLAWRHATPDTAAAGDDSAVPTLVTVQTGALRHVTLHRYCQAFGTIETAPATPGAPAASAPLAVPGAGIITRVNVVPGQTVTNGEVLIELDSSATTYAQAEQELDRQQRLFQQQNTSLKSVQDAAAQLALLRVTAPLAGTVAQVNVKPGQAADPAIVAVEVVDLNRLAVRIPVPSQAADEVRPGDAFEIPAPAAATGTVAFVSPEVNPANGTVEVVGLLPAGAALRPGQLVPLRIITGVRVNCLAAPEAAVVTDEHGQSLLALVKDGQAKQTPVQTGWREHGWVEVSAPGLAAGDTVVTVGAYGLPDQTKLNVKNPPDDGGATNASSTP